MPTFSGTVRSSDGVRTIDVTPNDVVTFTPSGTYTVEYPIGTVAIIGATTTQTLTGNTSATQMRIACASGSVAFSCVDGNDETKTLTPAAAAAVQALVSRDGVSSISSSVLGGASPWLKLFGPNELRQAPWVGSAEWTTPTVATRYVTAQSPANGPALFRREGAAILIDGAVALANTGNPPFGNYQNTSAGIAAGLLQNKTIAILMNCHRLGGNCTVILRIGTNTGDYVVYKWAQTANMLVEGSNMLIAHTAEPIGSEASPTGQVYFNTSFTLSDGWTRGAGSTFNFTQAIGYVAVEITGVTARSYYWLEGLYYGGKDKPKVTIGFDIQTVGLDLAKTTMDKYGLVGYAATPTSNGSQANPEFVWFTPDVTRLQNLYRAGWDIIQHSVSHNSLGTLSDNGLIEAELNACWQLLLQAGFKQSANLHATASGSYSNRVLAIAERQGVQWMRHVTNAPLLQNAGLVGIINRLQQGGLSFANEPNATRPLAFIDLLILYGCSGHMYTHAILASPTVIDTNVAVFDAFCAGLRARIDAGLIEVVTPSQYLAALSPLAPVAAFTTPSRLSLTPGASPFDLVNVANESVRFAISGGTVSAITYSRDGTTFDGTGETAGQFDLFPGDRLRITYTVAPTIIQYSL